jgi:hypothetical protein
MLEINPQGLRMPLLAGKRFWRRRSKPLQVGYQAISNSVMNQCFHHPRRELYREYLD